MTGSERITQARESMEEARLLSGEHMGNKAVLTKLYHAMMNCLFALFDIRDIGRLTHADIIERFEREYVKTGKIESTILVVLRRTYDLTTWRYSRLMPTVFGIGVSPLFQLSVTGLVSFWLTRRMLR